MPPTPPRHGPTQGFCLRRTALQRLALGGAALLGFGKAFAQVPPLELGVLPNVSARLLLTQYQPLQSHLSQKVGRPVQVSTAPSWREFYQRAKAGQYDIVVAAGNVARLAEKDLGFRPLVSYEPLVPALFITRKGDTAAAPSVLKNQSLALANPASLVAFEGLRWLRSQGLEAGTHYKTLQVKTDDSVGNTVLRGEAAAGVLSMGEFRAHPAAVREQLTVHTQFAEVASFLVSVNPRMDGRLAEQIRAALLAFDANLEEGRLFFERTGFKGIVPLQPAALSKLDAHVDSTRQLLD